MPIEMVALSLCRGRILRQDILAERDNPPFDRVCMDGVAMTSSALSTGNRSFHIQATQAAGEPPLQLAAPDMVVEVMTGAVLPTGADCVIPLEEYDLAAGRVTLHTGVEAKPWRNVQRRGADSQPGVPMLTTGMRLGAAEVAVVASAGLAQIAVSRQPRVMVVSTGDELVEPGQAIADYQLRRSNAHGICAALQLQGFDAVDDTHLPDDEAQLRLHLEQILARHDVVVLSGGVSKGRFDYVPAVLKSLGVQEVLHQIAQRPGRPLWFGVGPRGQLIFGLPGNPVATLICLARYVLPALRAAMLWQAPARERVALAEAAAGYKLTYFLPVALRPEAAALAQASAHPPLGSGDFLALAGTDGFVELPPQPEGHAAGFIADFFRW
jgi:molybdopterin molybdotransferase